MQLKRFEVLREEQSCVTTKLPFCHTQQAGYTHSRYLADSSAHAMATLRHNYQESDIAPGAAVSRSCLLLLLFAKTQQ